MDEVTEDALARSFTARYGANWRYVAPWGQWLTWNGVVWERENTLRVFDLARDICRRATTLGPCTSNQIRSLSKANTVSSIERLARADRVHAATIDQWDSDPWIMNTPGGVLDITSGVLHDHHPDAFMTKISSATPDSTPGRGGTSCPRWISFLKEVTGGDTALTSYLQRVCGYALTGSTREHALFFFYGTGANGKSVFLNTLRDIFGDYAAMAPIDMFLESYTDKHPTDMAYLRGARLVVSSELSQGKRWAEAKLKSLTGGDKIAARFMRQDFFEYTPQFKLMIAGNHKPALRDVDEAMRRRLHLIPFTITVPKEKRDPGLSAALLAERDGILSWCVKGALDWQANGLQAPAKIISATDEYFDSEDVIGRWILECCSRGSMAETTRNLFGSFKTWAEAAGEFVGSEKRFSQELGSRNFNKWQDPDTRRAGFSGIALRVDTGSEAPRETFV